MNRRDFLKTSALALGAMALQPLSRALDLTTLPTNATGQRVAIGYVYHNRSGGRSRGANPGIAGVAVSNGRDVVLTDRTGRYELPVEENTVLFVVKPSGWAVPLDSNNLPQHFYVHRPSGSPKTEHAGVRATGALPASVDFGLTPQKEDRKFKMVLCGDPQPRNQTEIDYMSHDVIEQLQYDAKSHGAKFGLSLGDIMFDDLALYESLNRTFATIGLPWYNVVGNHDLNFDSAVTSTSTETFTRHYGTPYFAFNYGQVHFLVLNNVYWRNNGADDRGYHAELTSDQLEFVKNDLKHVPLDRLVVVCMHIPLPEVRNKQELFRLLENRPHTVSFSAHTHVAEHIFIGEDDGWRGKNPHHHVNHCTVCGCWWGGAADERGIPHATMGDGGPNGYSIVEFDRNQYKITYRAASKPADHQMSIWLPEELAASETAGKTMIVNVFAGSAKSVVEARINDGVWTALANIRGQDPFMLAIKKLEDSATPPSGRKTAGVANTPHLWKFPLPAMARGTYNIQVKSTDMFGQVYLESRILRVV